MWGAEPPGDDPVTRPSIQVHYSNGKECDPYVGPVCFHNGKPFVAVDIAENTRLFFYDPTDLQDLRDALLDAQTALYRSGQKSGVNQ